MTPRTEHLSPGVHDYIVARSTQPDTVLLELAAETRERFPESASMQIASDQGAFMTLLARMIGATNAVEVGTFTGYSSICVARGLSPGGRLLCCDISTEWTSIAERYWEKAGVSDRVELRLGPALDTLRGLPADTELDLAFIDADKTGYIGYWEEIVPRIRPGGIVLVDNTLSGGRVLGDSPREAHVQAIRDFNHHAAADERVDLVLLPIGDGLTLAYKK